jgi:Zn-finger nucleic acid-binding protein
MKCPTCPDSTLAMTDRQGFEIDYCPQCRGVWLDRGELDKLIERAASMPPVGGSHRGKPHPSRPPYGRRPKSWLHEIFD